MFFHEEMKKKIDEPNQAGRKEIGISYVQVKHVKQADMQQKFEKTKLNFTFFLLLIFIFEKKEEKSINV